MALRKLLKKMKMAFFFEGNNKFIQDLNKIKANKCKYIQSSKQWALCFDVEKFVNELVS